MFLQFDFTCQCHGFFWNYIAVALLAAFAPGNLAGFCVSAIRGPFFSLWGAWRQSEGQESVGHAGTN